MAPLATPMLRAQIHCNCRVLTSVAIGDGDLSFTPNVKKFYMLVYIEALYAVISSINARFDQTGFRVLEKFEKTFK